MAAYQDADGFVWSSVSEDNGPDRLLRDTPLVLIGVSMHLEAHRVEMVNGVQQALDGSDSFDALHHAHGGDGPFETVQIGEHHYVVFAYPYC